MPLNHIEVWHKSLSLKLGVAHYLPQSFLLLQPRVVNLNLIKDALYNFVLLCVFQNLPI